MIKPFMPCGHEQAKIRIIFFFTPIIENVCIFALPFAAQ